MPLRFHEISLLFLNYEVEKNFLENEGAKGQLISKGLFKVFICTKKQTKTFSALAYKKRSNQKRSQNKIFQLVVKSALIFFYLTFF